MDKHWTQESRTDANSRTHSLTGSLGMNYVLDDNHSLGVTYRTTKRPYARDYMTVGTDVVRDDMPYESSVNDSRGARRICVMHSIFIIGEKLVVGVSILTEMPFGSRQRLKPRLKNRLRMLPKRCPDAL